MAENFEALGLKYDLNPSMKYSNEGKQLLKDSRDQLGIGNSVLNDKNEEI